MAQPVELPSSIAVGPVIDEGHSLASVSDKIAGIVLKRKTTLGWIFGFLISFAVLQSLMVGRHVPDRQGRRNLGHQHSGRLGIRHRQFRVVDRYRPCRHADFSHPSAAEPVLAKRDQPLRRSDDAVRRHVRRHVPGPAYRSSMAGLLVIPVSEHDGHVATVSEPSDLGRFRRLHLLHDFRRVLVCRADSRSGDAARRRHATLETGYFRCARNGLAQFGAPLAAIRESFSPAGGPGYSAGRFRAHGRQASTSQSPCCPAGTPQYSRPTSSPAQSIRALRWC